MSKYYNKALDATQFILYCAFIYWPEQALLADNFIVLDGLTGANAKPKHFTSWFSEI
jgi:hypothetical protein